MSCAAGLLTLKQGGRCWGRAAQCRVARVVLSKIASVAIPPGLDIGSNDYLCGKCRTELCKIKNTQEQLEQLMRAAMVDVLHSHHGPTQAHDPDHVPVPWQMPCVNVRVLWQMPFVSKPSYIDGAC